MRGYFLTVVQGPKNERICSRGHGANKRTRTKVGRDKPLRHWNLLAFISVHSCQFVVPRGSIFVVDSWF
jgi:hypothetical protein